MSAYKTLVRTYISCLECRIRSRNRRTSSLSLPHLRAFSSSPSPHLLFPSIVSRNPGSRLQSYRAQSRCCGFIEEAVPLEITECTDETITKHLTLEPPEEAGKDSVEELLVKSDDVSRLMKMERRSDLDSKDHFSQSRRWFPYLDKFDAGSMHLSSSEVLEALDPHILEVRKERFRNVAKNRSYSVCLVVEGLCDFGNVSATFRSADALGFQSVHVVSCNSSKRYRDNRHVSMGAEKWLDIELWNSTQECFKVLKSRGYRIATTHVGMDAVSIYDMDWSCPTAIVVGNENSGISNEALELSDLHCSIPIKGMVDSFNVSVAAGILMHHAVCDRTLRLGCHGDLTLEESQTLLAEFSLRHSKSAISIAKEYANRKLARSMLKL
ncbi:unnamed protein product [Ilex paraguariensis]|uniref:tRNA/rRNA methyltransferase SpoU type domain-containing protein n=1 Tax=Ilex paraguariensis TaxID=185542 RepID=A0ABC8T0P4_9AQUA